MMSVSYKHLDVYKRQVYTFQNLFGLDVNGVIGPITWGLIVSLYSDLQVGGAKQPGQFPGTVLQEG